MRRTSAGRHCDACAQQVFDLTQKSEIEARALALLFGEAGLCARARTDAEGFVVFRTKKLDRRAGFSAGLVALSVSACATTNEHELARHPSHEGCVIQVEIAPAPASKPIGGATPETTPPRTPRSATDTSDAQGTSNACVRDPAVDTCPKVIVVSSGGMSVIQQLLFRHGSADLQPSSRAILDETAKLILANPQLRQIVVEGHSDAHEVAPTAISSARAMAVVRYLTKKGVSSTVLSATGLGATQPVSSGTTPADRAQERRVSFRIVP